MTEDDRAAHTFAWAVVAYREATHRMRLACREYANHRPELQAGLDKLDAANAATIAALEALAEGISGEVPPRLS